jgi:spore maturation protein CgeB
MEIAFFGSSLLSAYWNGAATYYRGIIRALNGLGHHITFYEPDAYDRQNHRDIEEPSWAKVVVYSSDNHTELINVLNKARNADLVIKASGVGVFDSLLESAVVGLRMQGSIICFWDVDAPATLERIENDPADPFRPLIPKYDLVLTYGGGQPVVDAYKRLGARECVPIYNALDTSTHFPAVPDKRFDCDLALLANRLPDREARVEEFFLKVAEALPDKRFILGGSGWSDKPLPPNVTYVGHIYTADHNAFNSTPRAILNVNRDSMAAYGFSPPTRIFEAAGAGACVITDEWPGIEMFLKPDSEVLVAANTGEVITHLKNLTAERAKGMGKAAYSRMLAGHTYDQRVQQIQTLLDQLTAAYESFDSELEVGPAQAFSANQSLTERGSMR